MIDLEGVNHCGQNLEGASSDSPPRPARVCILERNVQGGDKGQLHMTPSSTCHVRDAASHKHVMGMVVFSVCKIKVSQCHFAHNFRPLRDKREGCGGTLPLCCHLFDVAVAQSRIRG